MAQLGKNSEPGGPNKAGKPGKPGLVKWSKQTNNLAMLTKAKEFKKRVHERASTTPLNLERKRNKLAKKTQLINETVKRIMAIDAMVGAEGTDEEKRAEMHAEVERLMNMTHLLGATAYADSMELVFDALAPRDECERIDPETGETAKAVRRLAAGDTVNEVHDMCGGMLALLRIQVRMTHDWLLGIETWGRDKNGVLIDPYFEEIDDEYQDSAEGGDGTARKPVKLTAQEAAETGAEVTPEGDEKPAELDLDAVKSFIDKGKDKSKGADKK